LTAGFFPARPLLIQRLQRPGWREPISVSEKPASRKKRITPTSATAEGFDAGVGAVAGVEEGVLPIRVSVASTVSR
jgi:hypothetical protein